MNAWTASLAVLLIAGRASDPPAPVSTPPPDPSTILNGWSWIYGPIVDAQTFVATGKDVTRLRLRVGRLDEDVPQAPLVVEIRDLTLETIYLRGTFQPESATRELAWKSLEISDAAPLKKGTRYVLLFHSRGTRAPAGWLVHQRYQDICSGGGPLRQPDFDFYFSVGFAGGTAASCGSLEDPPITPVNSGSGGGADLGDEELFHPSRDDGTLFMPTGTTAKKSRKRTPLP